MSVFPLSLGKRGRDDHRLNSMWPKHASVRYYADVGAWINSPA